MAPWKRRKFGVFYLAVAPNVAFEQYFSVTVQVKKPLVHELQVGPNLLGDAVQAPPHRVHDVVLTILDVDVFPWVLDQIERFEGQIGWEFIIRASAKSAMFT